MSTTLDEQINQLKQTIADIESQRSILGDEAVEASLIPIRKRLADLEAKAKSPREEPIDVPQRQRKLVTLLYMDVAGSTRMTQHLDPEDTMEIMDDALRRLAEPIQTHGGHVTRFMGDGFMAVFGNPIAREDDPEQAIRAGLDILKVAQVLADELDTQWNIQNFQVRVGINTGLAVLGGYTEAEDTIMGRSVNLAARMESAAPPGGLLISHDTYRHVRGVFIVEPQEAIAAKGFPEPVPVYLIKGIKPRAFRVQTRGVEGVETRMIGRQTELIYLQDALTTAFEEGEGQVVTISGEAGVGKSRLLYEFENWIELLPPSQDVLFFQGRARQESQGLPYSLLRDMFAFRFQILDDDSGEQARHKIETGFGEVLGEENDGIMRAHILGQLLGYDFSASPHLKGVLNDAEQLRNRGVIYLIQYFQALSQEMPVVIFSEDIHWGDDSSLDVVSRIGEYTPQHPLFLVCASRPILFERRPYWGEGQTYHTHLELRPLSKRESRQLVTEILKLAKNIPRELRELVVRGAEGNPFYMEELIKMLIEDGVVIPGEETWRVEVERLEQVDVPSTLAGVLQARLDSLPIHERTVLQQASVVGRLFWDRIVSYIQAEAGNGDDPQIIPMALTSLRNREMVYRHEESAFVGAVEYLFKHDVLREVTYESVIKQLRKNYHGLVADWLISNSGDRIGEYSGLIAEHLLMAGRIGQSCEYFSQAGDTALASYANPEAEGYYRQALDLSLHDSTRADLLTGFGEALFRQGQSEEAKSTWKQAIDLYQELRDSDHLGDIYARLSGLLWLFEGYLQAWNLCQEGLKLLEGEKDSPGYASLLAEGGRTALFNNVFDQVTPLCQRAIMMAERVGNLEVQSEASITLAVYKNDEKESIDILKEVIILAEENDLLRTASRSHNNIGAIMDNHIVDLKTSQRHILRSVEISRQTGDIEGMMFALMNAYDNYIALGELDTIEDTVTEFLQSSTAPETRVNKFLSDNRPSLMSARGEWFSAIDAWWVILKDLQDRERGEQIAWRKVDIANNILEQNRFGYYDDISDAESAISEVIEQDPSYISPQLFLVIVYIRQGRLDDARDQFALVKGILAKSQALVSYEKEKLSRIEFELAFTEKRWGDAVAVCKSLLEVYQNGGYRWRLARELIDLGDALIGRNEPGDLEKTRETYQQSLEMFTEMGAPGYIKVLEERLGDL